MERDQSTQRRNTALALRSILVCLALAIAALLGIVSAVSAQRVAVAPVEPQDAEPTPTPRPPSEEARPPWSDIPEGMMIIEGDIIVPVDFYERASREPETAWAVNFWPDGTVPYEFDANVTSANQTAMINAMAEWEAVADVDFVLRSGEADYVHIQASDGNSSAVGRQGGMQIINIYNWNYRFIMAHELAHTLGLWHEQSRPNRDTYVQIEVECVQDGYVHNFDIHAGAGQYPPNGYDFDSMMHYGQSAFFTPTTPYCASIGRTITVLPPNEAWQTLIGQRDHLSDWDAMTMSFLYPEDNWRFVDQAYTGATELGTFLEPYKDFGSAEVAVPVGGTIWIHPGTYSAVGIHSKAMTLQAPLGSVTLGP